MTNIGLQKMLKNTSISDLVHFKDNIYHSKKDSYGDVLFAFAIKDGKPVCVAYFMGLVDIHFYTLKPYRHQGFCRAILSSGVRNAFWGDKGRATVQSLGPNKWSALLEEFGFSVSFQPKGDALKKAGYLGPVKSTAMLHSLRVVLNDSPKFSDMKPSRKFEEITNVINKELRKLRSSDSLVEKIVIGEGRGQKHYYKEEPFLKYVKDLEDKLREEYGVPHF